MLRAALTLILVVATAAVLQSRSKEEWLEITKMASEQCTEEFQISDGNLTEFLESSNDNKKKCLVVNCFDEKIFGPFKDLAEWHAKVEAFVDDFYRDHEETKAQMLEVYNKCKNKTGVDDCDTMLQVTACSRQSGPAGSKLKLEWDDME